MEKCLLEQNWPPLLRQEGRGRRWAMFVRESLFPNPLSCKCINESIDEICPVASVGEIGTLVV